MSNRYHIAANGVAAEIAAHGAELQSLQLNGYDYLWDGNPAYWSEYAPNLFPYVGRMQDKLYTVNGNSYQMDIHGFAKDMTFSLEHQSADCVILALSSNAETHALYPYDFVFRVRYAIVEQALSIMYEVENTGEKTLYFGLGAHPGFRVPLEGELAFSDYLLEFAQACHPKRIGFSDAILLDGKELPFPLEDDVRLPLRHTLFDKDAIVLRDTSKIVTIRSDRGTRSVTVSFPDFQYIGVWHSNRTEAPFVCIEPWTSLPSRDGVIEELTQKEDLIRLAKGKRYQNEWYIKLDGADEI